MNDARMHIIGREGSDNFYRSAIVVDQPSSLVIMKDPDAKPSGQIDLVDTTGHVWARLQVVRYADGGGFSIDITPVPEDEGRKGHDVHFTANVYGGEDAWTSLASDEYHLTVEIVKR